MTVRLLVDLTPTSGAHGGRGIGSYVRGLAAALAAAPPALRSTVAVLVDGPEQAPSGYQSVSAWRGHRWRPQDIGWLTRWVADSRAMYRIGADAFHMTDPRAPFAPPQARRLAITAYDLIPLEPDVRATIRLHRRAAYRAYLRALCRADRVIAISATTATVVSERLGIDPRKIDVVYPVVTAPRGVTHSQRTDVPTFLFVGVPDHHKRPELAVAALAEFRRRHHVGRLRFIGTVAGVHIERLRELIHRAGVEEAVTIEGAIPSADLEDAFRSATALLAVSRVEGFGLPAVEATLRAVPVVAVDTPVARETLGPGAVFVSADPRALADAMEDPVTPVAEATAALADRYGIRAVSEALRRSYEALLDG